MCQLDSRAVIAENILVCRFAYIVYRLSTVVIFVYQNTEKYDFRQYRIKTETIFKYLTISPINTRFYGNIIKD